MSCYIHRLPTELLSIVFFQCLAIADRVDNYYIPLSRISVPLCLLQVCARWRSTAIDISELWTSISLHRSPRAPYGYDFGRDIELLGRFLRRRDPGICTSSVRIAYDDLGHFGNYLMWNDLVHSVKDLFTEKGGCQRLALNLPDDCMEKLLDKLDLGEFPSDDLEHTQMLSLSLESTVVDFCWRRYVRQFQGDFGARIHNFNLAVFPNLLEMRIDTPVLISFFTSSDSVTSLDISIYCPLQFEVGVAAFPRVQELKLDLRETLDTLEFFLEDPPYTLPYVHTLEIRSRLSGSKGDVVLQRLFAAVKLPNLKTLRLRCMNESFPKPSIFFDIEPLHRGDAELGITELVIDDFPFTQQNGVFLRTFLSRCRFLETIRFRSCSGLISENALDALTWSPGNELCPNLESLTFDMQHDLWERTQIFATRIMALLVSRCPVPGIILMGRNLHFGYNSSRRNRSNWIREVHLPSQIIRILRGIELGRTFEENGVAFVENI